jgi:hypothetical protein
MIPPRILAVFMLVILFTAYATNVVAKKERNKGATGDRLIVKWKEGADSLIGNDMGGDTGRHHGGRFKSSRKLSHRLRLDLVDLESGVDPQEALQELLDSGLVESAELDAEVSIDLRPDDARFDELWGMETIEAEMAWDATTGSDDVIVCVVDTGKLTESLYYHMLTPIELSLYLLYCFDLSLMLFLHV